MSEKLIVFFHDANDRYGLEDGFVLHASGEHFEELLFACKHDATKFPIQETVPGGGRIMVWEGERHRDRHWDSDDDPYFVGAWRAATAFDLIDTDLLGGHHMSAPQMSVKLLATHAQKQLPEDYDIALWFDSEGISTQLLDPEETRIDTESPLDFAKLCELAQTDAARRASE